VGDLARTLVLLGTLSVALAPGLAEARPGDLYIGNPGNHDVVKINHRTSTQRVVASGGDLNAPDSGAFTAAGKLMIADYDALGGALFRIDPSSGHVATLASGGPFSGPTDVAIGPRGSLYAVDPFAGAGSLGAIFKVNSSTGHRSLVSDGQHFAGGPLGIAVRPSGNILATDQNAGPGKSGALLQVNPQTGHQTFITQAHHLSEPYGMTLSGKVAYLADIFNDSIVRVRLATGRQTVVASGAPLSSVSDVALGNDGKLYAVNEANAKVIRVNPRTGRKMVFASGGHLSGPEGITVEP
jgi:sugar lactone lactonase YvrE